MNARIERLLAEVDAVSRNAVDDRHTAAILAAAIVAILTPHSAVDALGAPVVYRAADVEWSALRRAVKAVVADIGLERTAALFGNSPESLQNLINRVREPGVGRKARLLTLVADNRHFAGSIEARARR